MNKQIPEYLKKILKMYPKINSGRKNYKNQHIRIEKQIELIKKFIKKSYNKY